MFDQPPADDQGKSLVEVGTTRLEARQGKALSEGEARVGQQWIGQVEPLHHFTLLRGFLT
jgi:hypothetical protein